MSAEERPRAVIVNRCFVQRPKDRKLLIIRRSPTDTNNPNLWEVPGGKVDTGQDLANAQEREVMEETGLVIQPTARLVTLESFMITEGKYAGMLYLALFSITKLVNGKVTLSQEHTDFAWVTYDQMLTSALTIEVKKAAITLEKYLK